MTRHFRPVFPLLEGHGDNAPALRHTCNRCVIVSRAEHSTITALDKSARAFETAYFTKELYILFTKGLICVVHQGKQGQNVP